MGVRISGIDDTISASDGSLNIEAGGPTTISDLNVNGDIAVGSGITLFSDGSAYIGSNLIVDGTINGTVAGLIIVDAGDFNSGSSIAGADSSGVDGGVFD